MKPLVLTRWSIPEFVAREVHSSRHNPINRWRGGTNLTNDHLWRYDPVLTKPRAKT